MKSQLHIIRTCIDGKRRCTFRKLTEEERKQRFLVSIEKQKNGCWIWKRAVRWSNGLPYGVIWYKGKVAKAHRYAYEVFSGKTIPLGLIARHTCDHTLCCNPEHILIGTQKDNIQDAISRGRFRTGVSRGEDNGNSWITTKQVKKVMALKQAGVIHRKIAKQTGLSVLNVGSILQGRTWRHVTGLSFPQSQS